MKVLNFIFILGIYFSNNAVNAGEISHDDTLTEGTSRITNDPAIPSIQENLLVQRKRVPRKVSPRGAHYRLVRADSSPWSGSQSQSFANEPVERRQRPSYEALRGPEEDNSRLENANYSSRNVKRTVRSKSQKRSKKSGERKPVSRSMKSEIAEYAIRHGSDKAAVKFEQTLGRRLREQVIEKFIQRYQNKKRKSQNKKKSNA